MTQQGPPAESAYDSPGAPSLGPAPAGAPVQQVVAPQPAQPPQDAPQPGPERSPLDRTVDPFPAEFPEGHREAFTGLLLLGKLEHRFEWVGHRFLIRTCLPHELAEASLWASKYVGTDGYVKAYQAAILAACVVSIDGKPLPAVPLTQDDTAIEANADWAFRKLFPPLLDKVHEEYVLLELKGRQILDSMGKASG